MNSLRRSGKKLWTSHFIKILLVTFSLAVCYHTQLSVLPLYAQHIGGNKMAAGLMLGAFTISALLFRPLVGNLCDQKGRKFVLIIGIIIFAVISFLYSYAYAIWFLVFLRFVHGASFSAYSTSSGTIVADIVTPSRLMEGIGYSGMSNTLAMAIGPALGLYLINITGYSNLFRILFGAAIIGLILSFFVNYEEVLQPKLTAKNKTVFLEKAAIPPSLVMFFTSMAQISITVFLPTYALSRGIQNIGLFFTVYALVLLITRPLLGKLSDSIGPTKIIIPAIAIFALSLVHLAYAKTLYSFLLDSVLYGLGQGALYPILNGLAIKLARPEHLGAANSTFFSSIDLGYGIGSILLGAVLQYTGFTVIFFVSAGFNLVAIILYYFFFIRRKAPSERGEQPLVSSSGS